MEDTAATRDRSRRPLHDICHLRNRTTARFRLLRRVIVRFRPRRRDVFRPRRLIVPTVRVPSNAPFL